MNTKIILGVCGGIAAYKSPEIVRELRRVGADVRVVMTEGAQAFVTPLTLQAVSLHPVHQTHLDDQQEAAMSHIELARWAQWILIAPATAQCIAKLAHGFADDLLSTLCLASTAPILIAPAMNQQMWLHPATQSNLALLKTRGLQILGPGVGEQACGEFGPGRMLEPSDLVSQLCALLAPPLLSGHKVLITAGPTQEPIDPVRFISNHSSGKMGYALAAAAQRAGAEVTLISGPTALPCPHGVTLINVTTAQEMFNAVNQIVAEQAIFISTAAVTDYRPTQSSDQKLKTTKDALQLDCTKNPDILATVTQQNPALFTVGFAAETADLVENARLKLATKKCNLIIANRVCGDDNAFGNNNNQVTVLSTTDRWEFEKQPKEALARALITLIASEIQTKATINTSGSAALRNGIPCQAR